MKAFVSGVRDAVYTILTNRVKHLMSYVNYAIWTIPFLVMSLAISAELPSDPKTFFFLGLLFESAGWNAYLGLMEALKFRHPLAGKNVRIFLLGLGVSFTWFLLDICIIFVPLSIIFGINLFSFIPYLPLFLIALYCLWCSFLPLAIFSEDLDLLLGDVISFLSGVMYPLHVLPGPVRCILELLGLAPLLDSARTLSFPYFPFPMVFLGLVLFALALKIERLTGVKVSWW